MPASRPGRWRNDPVGALRPTDPPTTSGLRPGAPPGVDARIARRPGPVQQRGVALGLLPSATTPRPAIPPPALPARRPAGTSNRQRGSEQRRAYLDADDRYGQARDAELAAEVRAEWAANSRQKARDRWRDAAADKRRERQDRRQQAREQRPARRRLQRLRQHVADLRRRLTTLDTAKKAVERVLERLGLSKPPPAPAPPPPDRSPSLSSIMRDLDRHVERDYPTPVPEPVRAARPERPPPSRTPPAPRVGQQPPARERPPAAAPAASREAGAKPQVVQILIGAVCAGGSRLSRVRSEFERMDAGEGVRRLVLQAVDPELVEAAVGPRLAPAWVKPLRAQYARFKQAYPDDWVDVEKVWREQRER